MNKDRLPLRLTFFLGGMIIVSIGINLLIAADLGPDPWSVLHVGLTYHLPITVGQAVQVVGTTLIFLGWALKVPPTLGTFANMYLFGVFIDYIKNLGVISPPTTPWTAWCYLAVGILLFGIGNGIYLNGKLGSGPKDSLLIGLTRVTGGSVRFVKTCIDLSAVIIGALLGGKVGIGTLVFALTMGPVLQWSLENLKMPETREFQRVEDRP